MRPRERKTRTLLALLIMVAGAGLLPAPAIADGFGFYVYLLDYARLQRELKGELGEAFRSATGRFSYPEGEGSAFALLGVLEESDERPLETPRMYDGQLMGAEAFLAFGRELARRNPSSPGRFLITGRQFRGPGDMPACRQTVWMHGACGAAALFTPEETLQLFREINELSASSLRWPEEWMQHDLLRLRDVLQEAAMRRRAVLVYGFD